jgi:hypothetical protein
VGEGESVRQSVDLLKVASRTPHLHVYQARHNNITLMDLVSPNRRLKFTCVHIIVGQSRIKLPARGCCTAGIPCISSEACHWKL